MGIWCMVHPWMTFFLSVILIYVIDDVGCNVAKAIAKTGIRKEEQEDS